MKFLIEVNKNKANVTDIYRKVLSKKAKAVNLVKEECGKIIVEVWFNDKDFFETMVNLVLEVDFNKVVMINESTGDDGEAGDEHLNAAEEEGPPTEEEVPVQNEPPQVTGVPKDAGINTGGGDVPVSDNKPEEDEVIIENDIPYQDQPPVNADEITRQTLLANGVEPESGKGPGKSEGDKKVKTGENKKPKGKQGGIPRKREGAELINLFEIPEFPKELTLDNVVKFFEPMKDRVRESVTDVINVALDRNYECAMDWKDVVRVSGLKGKFLSDYDKTLSAKRIADVFEQYGYSVRFRAFLQLLRAHVDGKVVVSTPNPTKKTEEAVPEVKAFDVITDFKELEFLAQINHAENTKESISVMIMNAMHSETLSADARNRFYYMLVSTMAVKEYKPEGVVLLLEDIAKGTENRVADHKSETETEINNFVKQFTEQNGKQLMLKGFMKMINEYFRDTYFEGDLEFIHKIVSFEKSFNIPVVQVKNEPESPKEVKRFKSLDYPEDLEAVYNELWEKGAEISEIVVGIFNHMAGDDIPDSLAQYLTICAEAIAFDDLSFVYLDMGVSSTQAKVIQGELATILEEYTTDNGLPGMKLYEFLKEIRTVYHEEA